MGHQPPSSGKSGVKTHRHMRTRTLESHPSCYKTKLMCIPHWDGPASALLLAEFSAEQPHRCHVERNNCSAEHSQCRVVVDSIKVVFSTEVALISGTKTTDEHASYKGKLHAIAGSRIHLALKCISHTEAKEAEYM